MSVESVCACACMRVCVCVAGVLSGITELHCMNRENVQSLGEDFQP